MKQAVKILFILLALCMNTLNAKIILCDLGGTFVDVNQRTYALQELGIGNILLHGLTNNLQFNPKQKMFAALEKIDPRTAEEQAEVIRHERSALPKIYCDWMAGKYTDAVATRTTILEHIDRLHREENFFTSEYEYVVVRNAIKAMFTPEKLVKHQYAIEPMMQLLERIDLNEHTIVIVSNWDQHSYPLFLASEVGQRLCNYVKNENMIVSGYIGHNKPHSEFYQEIFKRYGNPGKTEYIFLDNEPVNIKAAKTHNIPSIHYTGDHKFIEQELIKLGII